MAVALQESGVYSIHVAYQVWGTLAVLTDSVSVPHDGTPAELCAACHPYLPGAGTAAAHARYAPLAHPGRDGASRGAGLDAESRLCMSCHDGSAAGMAPVQLAGDPRPMTHLVSRVTGCCLTFGSLFRVPHINMS